MVKIIDAHMHLIVRKKDAYAKEMQKIGVGYAIAIPDNAPPGGKNIDSLLEKIKDDKRFFAIGTVDILHDNIEFMTNKLDNLFKKRKIKGIKIFPGHDPIYPTDKRLIPFYKLCIKHNYPLIIHTGMNPRHSEVAKYNNPQHIVKIAKQFPKLKIIIAHYFFQKIDYCYKMTKKYKNISFDTSGLQDKWVQKMAGGKEKVKRILEKTVKDGKKVIFGTDWPCSRCEIKPAISLIRSLSISEKEKEDIFFNNANKIFRLGLK